MPHLDAPHLDARHLDAPPAVDYAPGSGTPAISRLAAFADIENLDTREKLRRFT